MTGLFTIRHYLPERDLPPLSRMLTEIESLEQDGEDTSEEYLQASLAWPNYRPAQDVWVAEINEELVGYAVALEQPAQQCTVYVVVHPSHRRKGLGSQLLQLTLDRAREIGSKDVLVYANEHNRPSNLFLLHHKFQQVGSSGSMELDAVVDDLRADFSNHFVLKRYSEINDPLVLLKALNECYHGMWGHQHSDQPSEEERRSPRFLYYYDANDILLLLDRNDAIIGICTVKPEGKHVASGEVNDLLDGPGIVPQYREQGLQREMVLAGIQHLRKRAMRPITLEFWGDDDRALNIYYSLGFKMVSQYNACHKELQ